VRIATHTARRCWFRNAEDTFPLKTFVIPAKAGIQFFSRWHAKLDPGFRRDDD